MIKIKVTMRSVGKFVEQLKLSLPAALENGTTTLGNNLLVSYKTKDTLTTIYFTPTFSPKRKKNMFT